MLEEQVGLVAEMVMAIHVSVPARSQFRLGVDQDQEEVIPPRRHQQQPARLGQTCQTSTRAAMRSPRSQKPRPLFSRIFCAPTVTMAAVVVATTILPVIRGSPQRALV